MIALTALGVALAAGGSAAAAGVLVEPDDDDDDQDDDPVAPPDTPVVVVDPPPPPPPGITLQSVWGALMSASPEPGRGYQVKAGDVLLGASGLIAMALQAGGEAATAAARTAYYQATTRVRSNWVLYATDQPPGVERVSVTGQDGATVTGSITAALLPVNDSWGASVQQGQLPRRLIKFARQWQGNSRVVVPAPGYQGFMHGGARTYGTIFFPSLSCIGKGPAAIQDATCDWPVLLWTAAGQAQGSWVP